MSVVKTDFRWASVDLPQDRTFLTGLLNEWSLDRNAKRLGPHLRKVIVATLARTQSAQMQAFQAGDEKSFHRGLILTGEIRVLAALLGDETGILRQVVELATRLDTEVLRNARTHTTP